MPDTDYFEIAKKLTRAHSKTAGKLYLKDGELGAAQDIVRSLVDQIIHMAEIAHRAYHDEDWPWRGCEQPLCLDASRLLASLSVGHGIDMRISELRRERDSALEWSESMEKAVLEISRLPDIAGLDSVKKLLEIIEEARRG